MGQISKVIHEEIIEEVADRNSNLLRVYRAPNDEITIHFRNLKIVLHSLEEQEEWKKGFSEALIKFYEGDYLRDDI